MDNQMIRKRPMINLLVCAMFVVAIGCDDQPQEKKAGATPEPGIAPVSKAGEVREQSAPKERSGDVDIMNFDDSIFDAPKGFAVSLQPPREDLFSADVPKPSVADDTLVDLSLLHIKRHSSGLWSSSPAIREIDRDFACYRVWLDSLINERQRLIDRGADPRTDLFAHVDLAIRYAVKMLSEGGEGPGPLPFRVTREELDAMSAPAPIVTLDQVLDAANSVPENFIVPAVPFDSGGE